MLGRGFLGAPRYLQRVVSALPSTLPNLEHTPIVGDLPGAATARAGDRARRAHGPAPRVARAAALKPHPAADIVQRPRLAPSPLRLRTPLARRGQVAQEPLRGHRQRRDRVAVRRRGASLADRSPRAAGQPARRPDPGVGAQRRAAGQLRQPHRHDERAVHDQRGRPGPAPGAHPRGAQDGQGTAPGAPGSPAPGRRPVHPAGGLRAGLAGVVLARGHPSADLEPRRLQRARAPGAPLSRRRAGA